MAPDDWYCTCGGRLSYGVYCKACQAETTFRWRPMTDDDRELAAAAEVLAALPAPRYPFRADD